MIDFLALLRQAQSAETRQGTNPQLNWWWLDDGILQFQPQCASETTVVISAGIHGNETAPIELLAQLCLDLLQGQLELKVNLLCILGNPYAIRAGVRYIENDMNRMFCGAYHDLEDSVEVRRAAELEQVVSKFYLSYPETQRFHFDLHTAIRRSYLETFALLPYQVQAYDTKLLELIDAAELDALVYHNAIGATFTQYTSLNFQAASVTLELGKAKPFGQNNLFEFLAIDSILRNLVAAKNNPPRKKIQIRTFKVVDSILKFSEDFKLNLADDAANFSVFHLGEVIATQVNSDNQVLDYVAHLDKVFILFPNNKVKLGLRAGLVLEEITA